METEDDVDTKSPSAFEDLPVQAKQDIASFLSVQDLLKLSETSKRINRNLDIVVVSSPYLTHQNNKAFQTDDTTQCFGAVIPNQEGSHSHLTIFACDVFFNRFIKGIIWIVEQEFPNERERSPDVLTSLPFRSGKAVATTTVTSIGKVTLSFFPKTGKFYQFWVNTIVYDYASELCLNNMMLHQVGLAMKPSRHVALQFEVLRRQTTRIFAANR